jgi:hypothetical protein
MGVYLLPFIIATANSIATTNSIPATSTTAEHSGLGLVVRENIIRYFAPFDHTGPIYTYLISTLQYTFPWSPVLIAALVAAWRRKFQVEPAERWNLWALSLIFLFFTLSGSRRNYYILPILPYCALLSARFLHDPQFTRLRSWALNIAIALLIALSVLQLAVPVARPLLERRLGTVLPQDVQTMFFGVGIISLGSLLAMLWWYRHRRHNPIAVIIGSSIIVWSGFFFWQQLVLDRYRPETQFARALKPLVEQNGNINAAIYRERPAGRLLYYSNLPLPVRVLNDAAQLQQFIDTPPYPKLILISAKYETELPESLHMRAPDFVETRYAWEKSNRDKMRAWWISTRPTN